MLCKMLMLHLERNVHLHIAPASTDGDCVLACKHLRVLPRHHCIEVIPAREQVVRAGVHVPVKDLCGCGIAQRAIGDQANVRVVRLDGKEEGQVIAYVGWVPTVLHSVCIF